MRGGKAMTKTMAAKEAAAAAAGRGRRGVYASAAAASAVGLAPVAGAPAVGEMVAAAAAAAAAGKVGGRRRDAAEVAAAAVVAAAEAVAALGVAPPPCPCSTSSLCARVVPAEPEVYAFSTTQNWPAYPWTSGLLTSVCAFNGYNTSLLCTAHAHDVRVTVLANYPQNEINSETYLQGFIAQQVTNAAWGYYDGINFDYEYPITNHADALALTHVMNATALAVKSAQGATFQVTADLAWSPDCIDNRCYDYAGIAAVVDKVFIMSYDLRSQVWPPAPCVASSNDALAAVEAGVANYTAQYGIPASSMILGVPFYGFDYECLGHPSPTAAVCPIAEVPYQGAPCSDAAGMPVDFSVVMPLLPTSTTGYVWDNATQTPYFNYERSGTVHQVVYDDATSLTLKYKYAKAAGMGGVGMWNIDSLDWTSSNPTVRAQTTGMWNALSAFKTPTPA